jgi:hypothetical protein
MEEASVGAGVMSEILNDVMGVAEGAGKLMEVGISIADEWFRPVAGATCLGNCGFLRGTG